MKAHKDRDLFWNDFVRTFWAISEAWSSGNHINNLLNDINAWLINIYFLFL